MSDDFGSNLSFQVPAASVDDFEGDMMMTKKMLGRKNSLSSHGRNKKNIIFFTLNTYNL